ncbi:hypothetical protein PA598K_04015 [Paenibacillus sp. 598K]|uniref:nucleotidyltransferase family protein n=1 Tax=Paenibacillus sp. 598K TaxID=1117987 RepID=UPI000FF92432|nr:nucleotidyltransferase family protein [Paenibacillus sp. 598K]GBF75597.1 hypothetical protein PA598K_04015 [Paenibacillus sp. 598K]
MNKEQKIFLLLSKLTLSDQERKLIQECTVDEDIHWEQIFIYSIHHNNTAVIYKNTIDSDIKLKNGWNRVFKMYFHANKLRNQEVYAVVTPILNAIYEEGIKVIPLKGGILNHTVYKDYGLRHSSDFDLLIEEKDSNQITKILISFGFVQSKSKPKNGIINPASRKIKAFHKMWTHELVPFVKKTNHTLVDFVEIDIQFDIFSRAKNMRVSFPIERLFKTAKPFEMFGAKSKCYILNPEYNLIQLCSHVFQDNTMLQNIQHFKDHKVRDFVDIYEFVKMNEETIDWDLLSLEIKGSKINEILYFCLYNSEQLFGGFVPIQFLEQIKPSESSITDQYGLEEAEQYIWKKPFVQRIFDMSRYEEIKNIDPSKLVESKRFFEVIASEK